MTVKYFLNMLVKQTTLFQELAKSQLNLQKAVFEKNYPLVEKCISIMTRIANAIHRAEHKRECAFKELLEKENYSADTSIVAFLEHLHAPEQKELGDAFRRFKIAALQARTFNEGIVAYSSSRLETMEGIINELYPERHGKTYTASGQRQKTNQPLVLDHSL